MVAAQRRAGVRQNLNKQRKRRDEMKSIQRLLNMANEAAFYAFIAGFVSGGIFLALILEQFMN